MVDRKAEARWESKRVRGSKRSGLDLNKERGEGSAERGRINSLMPGHAQPNKKVRPKQLYISWDKLPVHAKCFTPVVALAF